jgi:hypothetical protein
MAYARYDYCASLNHHVRSPFACYPPNYLDRRPATPGAYLNTSSNAAMDRGRLLCGLFRAVSASAVDLRFLDQEGEKDKFCRRIYCFAFQIEYYESIIISTSPIPLATQLDVSAVTPWLRLNYCYTPRHACQKQNQSRSLGLLLGTLRRFNNLT